MKELSPLNDVGPQNCLAFSVDGSKLATGGVVRITLLSNSWHSCFFFLFTSSSKNMVVLF